MGCCKAFLKRLGLGFWAWAAVCGVLCFRGPCRVYGHWMPAPRSFPMSGVVAAAGAALPLCCGYSLPTTPPPPPPIPTTTTPPPLLQTRQGSARVSGVGVKVAGFVSYGLTQFDQEDCSEARRTVLKQRLYNCSSQVGAYAEASSSCGLAASISDPATFQSFGFRCEA